MGNFLRKSVSRQREERQGAEFKEKLNQAMEELDIPKSFLLDMNDGFSGGRKSL